MGDLDKALQVLEAVDALCGCLHDGTTITSNGKETCVCCGAWREVGMKVFTLPVRLKDLKAAAERVEW